MAFFISDESAMDPEVLLPSPHDSQSSSGAARALWVGLPRAWAIGTFILAGPALALWDPLTCIIAVCTAALLACLRGSCGTQITGAGSWSAVLHHSASLAALAWGLRVTLQRIAAGRLLAWVTSHVPPSPALFSSSILLFVTFFFILGLERSRLFRSGLLLSMTLTLALLTFSAWLLHQPKLFSTLFSTPVSLRQVLEGTAFFSVAFSGSLDKKMSVRNWSLSSYSAISLLANSCITSVIFLIVIVDNQSLHDGVLVINALEPSRGPWLARAGLAALATVCLSLSLVEVLAVAQRSVAVMAGHILPAPFGRENRWTGTQLWAILLIGLVSSTLVYISQLASLLALSAVSYLLSISCDLFSAVYRQYQPIFVPKKGEEVESGGSYQLLSDTNRLIESEDSDSELSDDSGHSSDTDIDAAVHEFKETAKVTSPISEPVAPSSTVETARRANHCLLAILVTSVAMGTLISYNHSGLATLGLGLVVVMMSVLSRQPQIHSDPSSAISPWFPGLTLSFNILLSIQLISQVWVPFLLWSVVGLSCFLYMKRRQWATLEERVRKRIDRLHTPAHHSVFSSFPTYLSSVQVLR